MPAGTVKVYLVGATAIKDSEWIGKGDPYAVIECGNQHVRSNTATDQGSKPNWNQKFHFYIDDSVNNLQIKIYNQNVLQKDDVMARVTIPLAQVFADNKLPVKSFSLEPLGDINLQLSYTPKVKPAIRLTRSFPGPYSPETHSSPYVQGQVQKQQNQYYTGPYGHQHQANGEHVSSPHTSESNELQGLVASFSICLLDS